MCFSFQYEIFTFVYIYKILTGYKEKMGSIGLLKIIGLQKKNVIDIHVILLRHLSNN